MSAVEHESNGDVTAARIDRGDVALRNRGITRVRQASPGTKNETRRDIQRKEGGGGMNAQTHTEHRTGEANSSSFGMIAS
ncbi:hypothetical protein ASPBRDRAFT_43771 [Aspergillus brasiliensis CBS 101740]|uniref:Uncharacterized protein n=1 Tax=Aspergillus brasiliensis (strain CBS 101740 / IMI 381727 / IBT 21946) TaxID=767769 RepID=A0A1L9UH11_ASPBC|nr:hypothetical protein ASPBRDRAFT_43771 [Aspergillus brasiliensis CBS 101740]